MQELRYDCDLRAIFSRNYTKNGEFEDVEGIQNARLYKRPNSMDWLSETRKDCLKDKSRQNYGLIERITSISKPVKTGRDVDKYHFQKKDNDHWTNYLRTLFEKYFPNTTLDILCNSSCLVEFMNPNKSKNKITFFQARLCPAGTVGNVQSFIYLRHGSVKSKYHKAAESYSWHLENLLASPDETKTNANETVEALYEATLGPLGNPSFEKFIRIAFTAETDGLWEEQRAEDKVNKKSIVEIKSAKLSTLASTYFEEQVLRRSWAQCRIRDIDELIFGLVDEGRIDRQHELKEVWLYDVNAIPKVVQRCVLESKECKWDRAFSRGIILNPLKQEELRVSLTGWTENECFHSLHNALSLILSAFETCEPGIETTKKYFLCDSLTIQNGSEIEEVDESTYFESQDILNNKPLLLQIFSNPKFGTEGLDRSKPERTIRKILKYLKENNVNIQLDDIQYLKVLENEATPEQPQQREGYIVDKIEITFKDEKFAKLFKNGWLTSKIDFTPPYKMKISYQITKRQRRAFSAM